MIGARYLLRAVLVPSLAVLLALCAIFASYSITRYLAEAAQGSAAIGLILRMIGLRVVIALEVLLPLALYLGLIIGLGSLYANNEMTALQAGGLTRAQMLRPLLGFIALAAVFVAVLALFGRPWAYGQLYATEARAQTHLDLSAVTPGRFYASGDLVVYAQAKSADDKRLDDVFARFIDNQRAVIVRAAHMQRATDAAGKPTIEFSRGHLYQFDLAGENDRSVAFGHLQWHLQPTDRVVGYKRKAASTLGLMNASERDRIAERQWRFSRPLAALFLGMLGVSFARATPRRSRAASTVAAAVSFALYYGIANIARSWVEQGVMPVVPGVYWLDALVGIGALTLLFARRATHY